jgi:hypothetical protein
MKIVICLIILLHYCISLKEIRLLRHHHDHDRDIPYNDYGMGMGGSGAAAMPINTSTNIQPGMGYNTGLPYNSGYMNPGGTLPYNAGTGTMIGAQPIIPQGSNYLPSGTYPRQPGLNWNPNGMPINTYGGNYQPNMLGGRLRPLINSILS